MAPETAAVVKAGLMRQSDWDGLVKLFQENRLKEWGVAARELCRGNYQLWGVLVHGWDPMPHFAEAEKAAKTYDKLLLCASRESGKSQRWAICQITHDLCFGTLAVVELDVPKILLIQETEAMARGTVSAIKQTMETGGPNGTLKLMFPKLWDSIEYFRDDECRLKTRFATKEPALMAIGLGGGITGQHPRLIVLDDPVSVKNSRTPSARRTHIEWWTKTVLPMLGDGGRVHVIYTPYYAGDLPDYIKNNDKTFFPVHLPALNRRPRKNDYEEVIDERGVRTGVRITPDGADLVALWPCPGGTGRCPRTRAHYNEVGFHRSVEFLLSEKFIPDPIGFANQFMLELVDDTKTRIKPEMLRFYSFSTELVGKPCPYNETVVEAFPVVGDIEACVHAWDHAIGKKRQHDRTAFARAYRTKDNKVFFINKAGRWDFLEAVRTMESNYDTDPIRQPMAIATEGMGFQEAYAQALGQMSKSILPIENVKVWADKDTALVESGLLNAMTNGRVYVDVEDQDTLQELLAFTPDQRYHDDIVDAMRIAFTVIKRSVHKRARLLRAPGGRAEGRVDTSRGSAWG